MMLATHSLRDGAPQFSTSQIWSVETVFFSDKQAFLVSKLLKWETDCCLWYISIVDSMYKPLPTREKNVRPRKPRYILERTILETENAQSRILGGSCKQGVQALDLMNCTTHIVQDFTKLLPTNIWVRVVVITTLNYVLDASAFLRHPGPHHVFTSGTVSSLPKCELCELEIPLPKCASRTFCSLMNCEFRPQIANPFYFKKLRGFFLELSV